jgi:sporulation integral membrane protein YtvI
MKKQSVYIKILLDLLLAALVLVLLIFVMPKVIGFFLPFVFGYFIALIANPLVRLLEKRLKIVRRHGSAIVIIFVLAIIVLLFYLIIATLVRETVSFISDLPNLYNMMESQIREARDNMEGIYKAVPAGFKHFVDNFSENVGTYVGDYVQKMDLPTIGDAGLFVKSTAEAFFMFIITILSAYFFIADKEKFASMTKKIFPSSWIERYKLVLDNFKVAVGGYFKAQLKIMVVITAILFIGFVLLRTDYAILLALVIAFLDFLPFFGTGIVLCPWAVVEMISGNYVNAISLVVIYLVCQVVRQILQPKLVGDSIGISPMATLVFMYIGYKVKGLLGLILGIPIGMVLMNFYHSGMFDNLIEDGKIVANDINALRNIRKNDDKVNRS